MSQLSKHRLGSFLRTEVMTIWLNRSRKGLFFLDMCFLSKAWLSQVRPTRHKEKKQMKREETKAKKSDLCWFMFIRVKDTENTWIQVREHWWPAEGQCPQTQRWKHGGASVSLATHITYWASALCQTLSPKLSFCLQMFKHCDFGVCPVHSAFGSQHRCKHRTQSNQCHTREEGAANKAKTSRGMWEMFAGSKGRNGRRERGRRGVGCREKNV